MKKFIIILSAAALLMVASSYYVGRNNKNTPPKIENSKEVISQGAKEAEPEDTYLIKKYGEKIGVYRKGAGKPFRIIDTFVFTLPQNDVSMLSHGFTVYENELVGIVEDYTG